MGSEDVWVCMKKNARRSQRITLWRRFSSFTLTWAGSRNGTQDLWLRVCIMVFQDAMINGK